MRNWIVALAALAASALSILNLELGRSGLEISELRVGTTPATLYRLPGTRGPLVVVAHGFAGSRPLMQALSLTLAQSGYSVLAFDFEGHGRNPVPMSGDVASVGGTTALLVAETRRILAAGRELVGAKSGAALLGHSMATDILVRSAIAERQAGTAVDAVVAISMFSQAVTAEKPRRLLIVTGEWENRLRAAARDALRQVQTNAQEGETVRAEEAAGVSVLRRAVVAPHVEHVGVLFSSTTLREARDWLDGAFGRTSRGPLVKTGLWILLLLGGIVALFRPLASLLPASPALSSPATTQVSARRFLAAILLPVTVTPLLATTVYVGFLPVLVADYLMIHLALFGLLQLAVLGVWRGPRAALALPGGALSGGALLAILALVVWGVAVFGLALDRYAASFLPTAERLPIIAALCLGTVPFMVADSYATGAGRAAWWRRIAARLALFLSLAAAALLDPQELTFVLIILPVLLLFFLVQGLMGRWVAQRSGPLAAGLGLGLCLAWALGVTFPLFVAG